MKQFGGGVWYRMRGARLITQEDRQCNEASNISNCQVSHLAQHESKKPEPRAPKKVTGPAEELNPFLVPRRRRHRHSPARQVRPASHSWYSAEFVAHLPSTCTAY